VRPVRVIPALLATALAAGCSTYLPQYAYVPKPAQLELTAKADDTPLARTLVSVIGVRRAVPAEGIPVSVEIRVRVENLGTAPVMFDPASLALLSGDLKTFPAPTLLAADPVELAPGASATVDARFPFPDDGTTSSVSMDGLHVQWSLEHGGRTIPGSVTLTRRPQPTVVYQSIEPSPWRSTYYWRYCR
jgi:hypothetical protein